MMGALWAPVVFCVVCCGVGGACPGVDWDAMHACAIDGYLRSDRVPALGQKLQLGWLVWLTQLARTEPPKGDPGTIHSRSGLTRGAAGGNCC